MECNVPVVVDVSAQRLIRGALSRLSKAVTDPRPALRRIGAVMVARAAVRFVTKTDPNNRAWRPWARSTARRRAAEGRGTLLSYTGRAKASLNFSVDAKSVTYGYAVPYMKFHEFGAKKRQGRSRLGQFTKAWVLPARRTLTDGKGGVAPGDAKAIADALGNVIAEAVK